MPLKKLPNFLPLSRYVVVIVVMSNLILFGDFFNYLHNIFHTLCDLITIAASREIFTYSYKKVRTFALQKTFAQHKFSLLALAFFSPPIFPSSRNIDFARNGTEMKL